jgi:hypothetical protein
MAKRLNNPAVPALPVAPYEYKQLWGASTLNVLRLYFTQLFSLIAALIGRYGASYLDSPYGAFHDTSNQYDGSTTIPYAVRLNTTDFSNGVAITSRDFVGIGSIALTVLTITGVTSGRMYPANLLSGTGVTAGTYSYLQLSSTATPLTGPYNFVSGGAPGAFTVVLDDVTDLEARQFISGTGLPANTRITYVDSLTNTVTVSAAFTLQAAGIYTVRPWGYEGTYSVSPSQTVSSTTITGTLPSLITFDVEGRYNIQISLLFTNIDNNTIHDVDVWFKQNDIDIPDSNSVFSVPGRHSGANGQLVAALNLFVDVQAGDVVEIVWHTSSSNVFIETIPAQITPIRPAAPSAIVTVQFVSRLP